MKLRIGIGSTGLSRGRGERVAGMLAEHGHEVQLIPYGADNDPGPHSGGVLVSELRTALRQGEIDAAVQTMEHVPPFLHDDLVLAAFPPRRDFREAFVGVHGNPLSGMRQGARIGSRSPLRIAQLHHMRPDLVFVPVDGAIQDRIARVDDGDLDGLVVSAEAVHMVDLSDLITDYLDIIPAIGQGALAMECRRDAPEVVDALSDIEHGETRICIMAERSVLRAMQGFMNNPVGAVCRRQGVLSLKAGAFSFDGQISIISELGVPTSEVHALRIGEALAKELRARGADKL